MTGRRVSAGFTLIELLVASTIFFTFTVAVLTIYARSHATFVQGQTRMEARQNARVALDTLAGELRMAGYDPSGAVDRAAGDPVVSTADVDDLVFVTDSDGDGTTDRVAYRLVGRRLERSVASWTGTDFGAARNEVLSVGVEGFELGYFDDSTPGGRPLATPVASGELPAIRRVSVRVMTSHAIASATSRYPLELDITLRNAVGGMP